MTFPPLERILGAVRTRWSEADRGELVALGGVVVLSIVLHSWNMFSFPYYENDEATYVSRAWQFITTGELDVYTYRYDHAPAGWMTIGAWLGLTGGAAPFGSLLASGRVLMLVVHTISTVLVYVIAKRIAAGSVPAGVIAACVFAASPLGIYFQRRILLDNLMVLWLLVAVALLLVRRLTLGIVILSGIAFGIAVLTKLNAVFFGLGFLLLLWARSGASRRIHMFTQWLAFAGVTVLLFFLYAVLNQEFLPAPVGRDGVPTRVSLIDTFGLQLGRGDFAWPWDPNSSFQQALASWLLKDGLTLSLGALATLALVVVGIRYRRRTLLPLVMVVLILSYVAFLARGKVVLDLYVVPILPLLAIAVGVVVGFALAGVPRTVARPALAVSVTAGLLVAYATVAPTRHLYVDETSNQMAALEWVAENVGERDVIVADNYVYPSLAQEADFGKTLYFFNAEYDPEARSLYGDDWRNIDYLVVTHEVVEQISQGTVPGIGDALAHARLRADFSAGTSSYIDVDARISTNGDWAQVYEVQDRNEIVLQDSWGHYRDEFLVSYGQVVDRRGTFATTTTADQVVALEQALRQDDVAAFLGVWQWTADHFRHRVGDTLLSSQWVSGPLGEEYLARADSDCGADLRIIDALAAAAQRWDDAAPLAATADEMLADWWVECTFVWEGMLVIDSSADGAVDDQLVNPSFFDPSLIESLASRYPDPRWEVLLAGGYALVDRLLAERGTVPDWVVLSLEGRLLSAAEVIGPGADEFGEDSLRLVPSLIRAEVAGDARASVVLDALTAPLLDYRDARGDRAAEVTVAMLALVRDLGLDPARLYRDAVATDYVDGEWTASNRIADHIWAWSWHRLLDQLPPEHRIPLL